MKTKVRVIVENCGRNFSCFVEELPGCVATGVTIQKIEKNITEAIQLHLKGMKEDNEPIPEMFKDYKLVLIEQE